MKALVQFAWLFVRLVSTSGGGARAGGLNTARIERLAGLQRPLNANGGVFKVYLPRQTPQPNDGQALDGLRFHALDAGDVEDVAFVAGP